MVVVMKERATEVQIDAVIARLIELGMDVHRLRCALAAEGLASVWLPDTAILAAGCPPL